jgi:hypothetical protein
MFVDMELERGFVMCLSLTPQIADVAATLKLTRHSSRNQLWLIDYKRQPQHPHWTVPSITSAMVSLWPWKVTAHLSAEPLHRCTAAPLHRFTANQGRSRAKMRRPSRRLFPL